MAVVDAPQLFEAIKADDAAAVRAALEAVAPPTRVVDPASGVSALLVAIYYGRGAIKDMLLAVWPPLDIFEAAALGDETRVRELVAEDRSRIDAMSPDGFPVVTLAATCGSDAIVKYLLSQGADVNAVATNGTSYTALTGTVAHGREDMVALLLAHGADAAHRYGPGWSPLHEAASNGNLPLITLLLDHGAELNAKNDEGNTPLALAMNKERGEAVELLRARGGTV